MNPVLMHLEESQSERAELIRKLKCWDKTRELGYQEYEIECFLHLNGDCIGFKTLSGLKLGFDDKPLPAMAKDFAPNTLNISRPRGHRGFSNMEPIK